MREVGADRPVAVVPEIVWQYTHAEPRNTC